MTINPLDDRPISSRERALQPTTISTYHCHKSMQATVAHNNTAIHLPVLAPSFIEVYTYFIIPSALLDQWKLLGVFSTCHSWMAREACWYIQGALHPAMKMKMKMAQNILHCQPYSYHIKIIMYCWNCRYINLEKKETRLPIHCYLNTHT